MKDDLAFISGDFFDRDIPKDRKYMLPYFDTEVQFQFLRYYLTFNSSIHFVNHTGYYISRRWRKRLRKRFLRVENAWAEANALALEGDFDMLTKITDGKLGKDKDRKK
ncbi:MAG: hypothetical protein ACW99G_03075 [Candidatus Thorarchaeota archaeon]|jgi:hypothetical protein